MQTVPIDDIMIGYGKHMFFVLERTYSSAKNDAAPL